MSPRGKRYIKSLISTQHLPVGGECVRNQWTVKNKKRKRKMKRTVIFGDTSIEAVIGAHQVSDDETGLSVFTLTARVNYDAVVRILNAGRVRNQRSFLNERHLRQRIAWSFTRQTHFAAHDSRSVQVFHNHRLHDHLMISHTHTRHGCTKRANLVKKNVKTLSFDLTCHIKNWHYSSREWWPQIINR